MNEKIVAYCGLVCSDCEAYTATQSGDREALEAMARRAHEEYGVPDATAESARCDGCLGGEGYKSGYCFECGVRACAIGRGVTNCAHCDNYGCETLTAFIDQAAAAKELLEQIRGSL
ncbi:MAG: DUF3795 domain-containing protein [Chloroflexi bacterium]|nr:DUF3795 domain-containing protein [Chloroflexota bacterium]